MTERIIRYSATNTFLESPREYLVKYIWELERVYEDDGYRPAFAFDVGNIGHAGLRAHYLGEDITAAANAAVVEANIDPDGEEASAGFRALDRHLMWLAETDADKGMTVVAAEDRLFLPFGNYHGDDVVLTFEPDLLMRDRYGMLRVIDWKFPAGYERLSKGIETNTQGLCYTMGVAELFNEMPSTFELRQTHRKPPAKPKKPTPVVKVDTQWCRPEVIDRYRKQLQHVVANMVKLHQEVEDGDTSNAFVVDHTSMFPCSASEICCNSLLKSDAEIAELIGTRFRKRATSL